MSSAKRAINLLCASLGVVAGFHAPARAQGPDQVLLVVNEASDDSLRVGEHYARARGIPPERTLRLRTDVKEEIDRRVYEAEIEAPLATWLTLQRAQDRILFIVLSKDLPLRIAGTGGRQATKASVDSELTLLYRKLTGRPVFPAGPLPNPYFLGARPVSEARPFSHELLDMYLVTRLEAFSADDAIALVDRAQRPASSGRVVLDTKAAWTETGGNDWLKTAAERVKALDRGYDVLLEETAAVVTNVSDVLGYYSWGSNDRAIKLRHFGLRFLPGAIAGMFVSTDARTFKAPPADWTLGDWDDRKTFYAGSPQSLAGDLIHDGVTGVAGHVTEPYLDATIRPEILFPAYLSGFSLAEAYYLAMPYLSWQTVVVGDPLCAVAKREAVAPGTSLAPPIDPETELPAFFGARRLAALREQSGNQGLDAKTLKLLVKADALLARRDKPGGLAALVEATALNPKMPGAQLILADEYDKQQQYEKAAERYTLVLELDRDNVMALNNLAYLVAVRREKPAEALALAERAYALSRGNPAVADTLAWVHHLAGHAEQAAKLAMESSRAGSQNAEIQLHAAIIFLAAGQEDSARQAYDRVAALDRTLLDRAEAAPLRARFEEPVKQPR